MHATNASAPPSKPERPHWRSWFHQHKTEKGRDKRKDASALAAGTPIRYTILEMSEGSGLPNKQDVARALLLKGTVFVHLDPRCPDVVVPAWLQRQPQLVLQVGLDMALPIPDLRVDDVGVYATLSFNRSAFTCIVPWHAVFAVVGDDGRGMVWPASMPKEIAAEVAREARRAGVPATDDGAVAEGPKRKRRTSSLATEEDRPEAAAARLNRPSFGPPSLELIAGDGSGRAERSSGKRGVPPYLRIVK